MIRSLFGLSTVYRSTRVLLSAFPRSQTSKLQLYHWNRLLTTITVNSDGNRNSVGDMNLLIKDLRDRIADGVKWETLDIDSQNNYQNFCESLPKVLGESSNRVKYDKAKEGFYVHLRMVLDGVTTGFVIKRDFIGFTPNLSVDFAIYHDADLLGFIVLDEPEHFSKDGILLPHHTIKELLHRLKYHENTVMVRIPVTSILTDSTRDTMVLKSIEQLVEFKAEPNES